MGCSARGQGYAFQHVDRTARKVLSPLELERQSSRDDRTFNVGLLTFLVVLPFLPISPGAKAYLIIVPVALCTLMYLAGACLSRD